MGPKAYDRYWSPLSETAPKIELLFYSIGSIMPTENIAVQSEEQSGCRWQVLCLFCAAHTYVLALYGNSISG